MGEEREGVVKGLIVPTQAVTYVSVGGRAREGRGMRG